MHEMKWNHDLNTNSLSASVSRRQMRTRPWSAVCTICPGGSPSLCSTRSAGVSTSPEKPNWCWRCRTRSPPSLTVRPEAAFDLSIAALKFDIYWCLPVLTADGSPQSPFRQILPKCKLARDLKEAYDRWGNEPFRDSFFIFFQSWAVVHIIHT